MSAKPFNLFGDGTEAVALRLCREVYCAADGRILWWEAIDPIRRDLGIDDSVTQSAIKFAASKRWIATVGSPILSVSLLEAGRRLFAEEDTPIPSSGQRSWRE